MRQEAVRAAVSRFVELPIAQRSVVVLKDVLGHSLEDIAALLDTTGNAVKGHLARGRARLKEFNAERRRDRWSLSVAGGRAVRGAVQREGLGGSARPARP